MEWLTILGKVSTCLLVLFSVQDVIGAKRVREYEHRWLTLSDRLFDSWRQAFARSSRWWPRLMKLSAFELSVLIAMTALVWFGGQVGEGWRLPYLFAAMFLTGCIGLLHEEFLEGVFALEEKESFPLEARWAGHFVQLSSAMAQVRERDIERDGALRWWAGFRGDLFAYKLLLFLVASSTLLPFLCLGAIVLRFSIYSLLMCVWVMVFSPARCLQRIGQKTGAEGFVDVGKYVLTLAGAVAGLFAA